MAVTTNDKSVTDDCVMPCWVRVIQRFFFGTITPQEKRKGLEVERALSVLRAFTILGLFATFAYGLAEGGARGAFVASLGGAGAFAVGGLLGFLFGLPRWTDVTVVTAAPSGGDKSAEEKEADKAVPKVAAAARDRAVRPNTNLERVMDWLTTLIVGLGLVHWEAALKLASESGSWFTAAIEGGSRMARNGSSGGAILVAFVTGGFILVYLWSQRYMGEEMARADRDSRLEEMQKELDVQGEKLTDSKKRQNEMAEMVAPQAAPPVVPAAGAGIQATGALVRREGRSTEERFDISQLSGAARRLGLTGTLATEVRKRYRDNTGYFDEPMRDFGPAGRGTVQLTATVSEVSPGVPVYRVVLRLATAAGANLATEGHVVFFLHHTLPESIRAVKPTNGEATIEVISAGSFIAGAVIVDTDARFSLDLAQLPGVSKDFRDN